MVDEEVLLERITQEWLVIGGVFARKSGGGIMMMDISDPSNPTYAGSYKTEGGNGGYAYYHQGYGFVRPHWAAVLDIAIWTISKRLAEDFYPVTSIR